MNTSTPATPRARLALRRAAVRATLAPSVHNTQPWRLVLGPDGLRLRADPARRLSVLDPTGRQLTISCGCALMNARVALAADGVGVVIERLPDPADPTLLAVLAEARGSGDTELGRLDAVVELRHTNRRRFADDPVPEEVVEAATAAAAAEGAALVPVGTLEHRLAVARLAQQADRIENANPTYRAELRAWTTDDPGRVDGVPAGAVPHVSAEAQDDVPIRDFDTTGSGALPGGTHSSLRQCLLLLCTRSDHPADWLRAGEALERALLEITRHGYVASPVTQITEVPSTRAALRAELGLDQYPHVLLRVGRAPSTPATRRRRLVDVLDEEK